MGDFWSPELAWKKKKHGRVFQSPKHENWSAERRAMVIEGKWRRKAVIWEICDVIWRSSCQTEKWESADDQDRLRLSWMCMLPGVQEAAHFAGHASGSHLLGARKLLLTS